MYPVSAAFQSQILKSHTMLSKCEVFYNGVYQQDLIITDGQVTMDYGADIQRRCKVDLRDPDGSLTPTELTDLLGIAGQELKLYRGILLRDGTEEYVPLGVFNISVNDITDGGDSHTIQLTGYDRSRRISVARFTEQYIIEAGTNTVDAIRMIALDRYAQVELNLDSMPFTTPQMVADINDDPWKLMQRLSVNNGCDLFFDGNGVLVCRPITDPLLTPVSVDYAEGNSNTLLSINKRWKDDDVFNWVVVTGESAGDDPVFAEAYDDDPASPTYIGGPHGIHMKHFRSDSAIETTQAQQVAYGLLWRYLGMYEQIRFNAVPHPALEPVDRVYIERAVMGIANNYTLDKISIPLTSQRAMECTVRQR